MSGVILTDEVIDTLPISKRDPGISPMELAILVVEARETKTTKARLRQLVELFAATTVEYQREAWRLRKQAPNA